jgi:hypothetical protein
MSECSDGETERFVVLIRDKRDLPFRPDGGPDSGADFTLTLPGVALVYANMAAFRNRSASLLITEDLTGFLRLDFGAL